MTDPHDEHDHPGWADNVERMFLGTLKFLDRNRPLVWILALGGAITAGVMDVPVFQAIVDGLVRLAESAIPAIGGGG